MMKVVVLGPKFWKKLAMQYWSLAPTTVTVDGTYKEDECLSTGWGSLHGIVSETHTDEDDGEDGETHKLIISDGRI